MGSSRFARRYSGSRCCFPLLGVLRCFNSPGSLYRPYVFRPEYRRRAAVGFPIRISTDQSLVGSSPWLFAATHVLHRLQAPRHPPLALCSLENKDARARYGVLKGQPLRPRRSTSRCARDSERPTLTPAGASASPEDLGSRRPRCRSLKTEQRCPPVLAAPHRRPMVYDRGDARTTE